jgi:alkanesulfonate monooxygenase SsuD/methylene tetrahydromethanopterin reductase-like flavin-dependent oxidoreductase (luciferase family)
MGEEKYGKKVEKVAYLLTCVASNEREAYDLVKRYPFFIYQLSEVVSESSLVDYGVDVSSLPEIRDAWRKRDLRRAAELVSDDMVQVLSASGIAENVIEKVDEYGKSGVDLLVISPIGNYDLCLRTFVPLTQGD